MCVRLCIGVRPFPCLAQSGIWCEASQPQILNIAFQNGAKSGFGMCCGPSTLRAGAKSCLESRLKKFTPHYICRTGTWRRCWGMWKRPVHLKSSSISSHSITLHPYISNHSIALHPYISNHSIALHPYISNHGIALRPLVHVLQHMMSPNSGFDMCVLRPYPSTLVAGANRNTPRIQ